MRRRALALVMLLGAASNARADLVFLASGRTLSVRAVREDGNAMVLTLRGGGEITCDRAMVVRVMPDEVPYPEPEEAPVSPPDIAPIDQGPVPFADLIDRSSSRHGVDANLVKALIRVESGYQSRARSPKGAMGLMQLMPETARRYAVRRPYDPAANIEAGTRHLKSLLDRFPLALALAAYNAGEAAVERFNGIPPYPETRDYVARILQLLGRRAESQ
jgi:soluble lytic murein transglycosylase-like protein